ncbi:hypothetical protein RAS_12220 [Rickettsia asiatica]|uniref:Uncharacterized protein n=1 Tax=Rickettsia asiatica TaxID=238800 RepID=A0A510G8C7_9RICK|nr:hypothetical protein RAS_12220 [Rickettsia asiatica]
MPILENVLRSPISFPRRRESSKNFIKEELDSRLRGNDIGKRNDIERRNNIEAQTIVNGTT